MSAKPRRRRDAGDICQLRVELWATVKYLSSVIANGEMTHELRLRASSAHAAVGGVYRQLLETSDLEQRISALEQQRIPEYSHNGKP
jgi:hypothetical protein